MPKPTVKARFIPSANPPFGIHIQLEAFTDGGDSGMSLFAAEAQIAGAGAYDPYTPALSASSYMMWDEGGIDADRPDALWCSVFCCP